MIERVPPHTEENSRIEIDRLSSSVFDGLINHTYRPMEHPIRRFCREWFLNEDYFVAYVDQLKTDIAKVVPQHLGRRIDILNAGCIYILCRLTGAAPSITDVLVGFPSVTSSHLLTIMKYAKDSPEYRDFRTRFIQPWPTPCSRIVAICLKIGLSPDQVDCVCAIRRDIEDMGYLSNRPSTIDGVALLRFRNTQHNTLCPSTIEFFVRRNIRTIRTAYRKVYIN